MLHSSEKWYPCPFICLCVPSFKMNMLLNQGYDTLFNQPGMSSNGWQHILMIFFCIMMKFSFSRVLTWMYFYRYLTDAIFLKSSDVTGYFYDLITAASFVLSYRGDMGTLHFCLLRCHWETLPFGWRFHWLHSGMKTWVLLANNDYIYKYI